VLANHNTEKAFMLYIALLHYPVCNKKGKVVTTAIANMDIHDIARAAKTYGVTNFYVINPIDAQQELARKIMGHWQEGFGATYNPSRKEAFDLVRIKSCLDEVIADIATQSGHKPQTIVTGANLQHGLLTFLELKVMLKSNCLPYLLIFGTGSGLTSELVKSADYRLEPIKGEGHYNHLAVRSAIAIILDRLASG
jgi:hypothetical protein